MSDLSNPTTRVLEVLNFLAAHPTEAFTLAEISRQLGLSKSTTHRILVTMAEARFLSRHPAHKTFSLGVAPVAIGEAALGKHRGIEIARREIAKLALELNVQCTINAMVEDDLLLIAKEGMPQTHSGLHRVGERTPIVPPVGIGFMAWANAAEMDAYLAKAADHLNQHMGDHLRAAFAVIRQRGYATAVAGPAIRNLRQTMILPIGRLRDSAYWESLYALISKLSAGEIQLFDFADAGADGISHISAPVFSPAGTVAFELLISGMPQNLSVGKMEEYAERLRTAAANITSETRGNAPKY